MLEPLAAEASPALELDVAGQLPRITADADRMMQVLSNVVGNAIKFTPAGGPHHPRRPPLGRAPVGERPRSASRYLVRTGSVRS